MSITNTQRWGGRHSPGVWHTAASSHLNNLPWWGGSSKHSSLASLIKAALEAGEKLTLNHWGFDVQVPHPRDTLKINERFNTFPCILARQSELLPSFHLPRSLLLLLVKLSYCCFLLCKWRSEAKGLHSLCTSEHSSWMCYSAIFSHLLKYFNTLKYFNKYSSVLVILPHTCLKTKEMDVQPLHKVLLYEWDLPGTARVPQTFTPLSGVPIQVW